MKPNRTARLALTILLALGTIAVFICRNQIDVITLENWLDDHPVSAPLLFALFYIVMTLLFFVGTLLSLMGGALFGPLWGSIYNQLSAILGATLTFLPATDVTDHGTAYRHHPYPIPVYQITTQSVRVKRK